MSDRADFHDAGRGFISLFDDDRILDGDDEVVYEGRVTAYIGDDTEARPSMNPSLWRQS